MRPGFRGFEKIRKRYCIHVAGRNLGLWMLACFAIGIPRYRDFCTGLSSLIANAFFTG
jgi:hypothetical protein